MKNLKPISFIISIFLLSISCLLLSEDNKIGNYNIVNSGQFNSSVIDTAIISAYDKFTSFYGQEPTIIDLIYIQNEGKLQNSEITTDKTGAQLFVTIPGVSGASTSFVKHMNSDSITQKSKNYLTNPKRFDNQLLERYFLWTNIFFKYFDINAVTPQSIPQWFMLFSVIEVLELEIPDNTTKIPSANHLKNYFLTYNYDPFWKGGRSSGPSFYIPKKDAQWSGKWKYFILNYSSDLSLSPDKNWNLEEKNRYLLYEYILLATFLKESFDERILQKMLKEFEGNHYKDFYLISFLREEYGTKININQLDHKFKNWLKARL